MIVVTVLVALVSCIGIAMGIRNPGHLPWHEAKEATGEADKALSYRELRELRRGINAHQYDGAFALLEQQRPGIDDPVLGSEEEKLRSLSLRAENRAYAGAPPTIPHTIQQRKASACLSCHEKGSTIAGNKAPAMSHKPYSLCTQCHAARVNFPTFSDLELGNYAENDFTGAPEHSSGGRAWKGAPPTIPHATLNRENCASCHGTLGAPGIRTTHPERTNCRQCHADSASFDPSAVPTMPF